MAAPKKPTHVVIHDSLYLAGKNGKPELNPKGKALTLSAKQAEKMIERGMVAPIKEATEE